MIVDSQGKPIQSGKAAAENASTGKQHYDAILAVIEERKVTHEQLADVVANLFVKWAAECNAAIYEHQCMNLMSFLATQADHWMLSKQAEMKIRQSAMASNPGYKTTQ